MSKIDALIQKLCPDGVEYKCFDDACSLHARIGWQRLTKAEYQSSGDYMLITGTDFTPLYKINYKTCVYVSEERYIQDPKIQIRNGDILITKDGTLGKVAQVNDLQMPATLNGGVFVVRPKDNLLLPRFIMHYLLSEHFQGVVERQKTGSTISHLTQGLFSRLPIPIPPLRIQREIVRIL
ncbi:MAG: restriction endonuclease subunit S, partial [Planctomycetia bacterium]|nr:restriction endonuclease subunit S [Planctomycetia bacterium]